MRKPPLTYDGVAIWLVETDEELKEALEELWSSSVLALDLEFDQNRFTYGFNLCLIQITDGKGKCFIIDPFMVKDLKPLFQLLEAPDITKIIHHANNDILLLNKLGCKIKGVMDTDVAAKILNFERSSLATVLKTEFDKEIDKSQQSSNWNKRPLTEDQIIYAAIDIIYLHRVKDRLVEQVKELERLDWLEEENFLLEQLTYAEPVNPHLKLRNAYKLNIYQQFILKELFAFREKMGKKLNKPAPYVISNEALVELANNPNTDVREWINHSRGIHTALKKPFNEKELVITMANAKKEAKEQHISHEYVANKFFRPIKTPETEARKEALTQVQKKIVEKYGEFATRLIITQGLITEYSQTGKLRCVKQYATEVLLQTAAELNIALPVPATRETE
ncbi:ribonuclease D [Botryobacter ruber]|uniref:ribonuclease D n=1 Tax=Botryobacter ruber TaxID=2171629 RepID=UPI000E0B1295|nr:ribonuclease D [Botryobacter ruber]